MRIAVMGSGGVGGYFGGRLAQAGEDGRVTARAESILSVLKGAGIQADISTRIQVDLWRYGREVGVPTPFNFAVYACLRPHHEAALRSRSS